MDKSDKLHKIIAILRLRRRPVSNNTLAEGLGCSARTVERHCEYLRDQLHAPLIRKPRQGWFLDDSDDKFELIGTWLTSRELTGLASLLNILQMMESEFIDEELAAIKREVERMLTLRNIPAALFSKKVKVIPSTKQTLNSRIFHMVSDALLNARCLHIEYKSYQGATTQRIISPQKLIHYQENWSLDSYCHLRNELRQFKLSRIISAAILDNKAKKIPTKQLNEHFSSSYGIFAGKATRTAKLRFEGGVACEVAMQNWHPEQIGEWQGNDYVLTIPFHEDKELIRDILKYGNNVEVLSPTTLRKKITNIAAGIIGINTGKRVRV